MATQHQELLPYLEQSPKVYPTYQSTVSSSALITEITYDRAQPLMLRLLLPFLQQLGQQPRWQLWLSPETRLNRDRLKQLGLSENRTIELSQLSEREIVSFMEKALSSGNFSSVTAWLPRITDKQKDRLQQAAIQGNSYGFILRAEHSHPIFTSSQRLDRIAIGKNWH